MKLCVLSLEGPFSSEKRIGLLCNLTSCVNLLCNYNYRFVAVIAIYMSSAVKKLNSTLHETLYSKPSPLNVCLVKNTGFRMAASHVDITPQLGLHVASLFVVSRNSG